ncbi:MAG: hypothetical protein QM791_09540 [Ferruginibacter sp.]
MRQIFTFLLKVFVKQFYIIHTGFFLFCFLFFFGIVSGDQLVTYHKSLILSMLSSPFFLVAVMMVWFLYNLKCIGFCMDTVKAGENHYLFNLKILPVTSQYILYSTIALQLYAPVLIYSGFVIYMALNTPLLAIAVLLWQLLMIILGAYTLFVSINHNNRQYFLQKLAGKLTRLSRIEIGHMLFLFGHIIHSRKKALIITKVFALLLLSVSFILNSNSFDIDLFGIFFQLIIIGHAMIVYYCVQFKELNLSFSRNLPVALSKTALLYILTYAILLVPELLFMLVNNHGNLLVSEIICFYSMAVASLFLFTAVIYTGNLDMDDYLLKLFILFILLFFFQKTGWYLIIPPAIFLAAFLLFLSSHNKFEKKAG